MSFFVPGDLDLWPLNSSERETKHAFHVNLTHIHSAVPPGYFIYKKVTDSARNRILHSSLRVAEISTTYMTDCECEKSISLMLMMMMMYSTHIPSILLNSTLLTATLKFFLSVTWCLFGATVLFKTSRGVWQLLKLHHYYVLCLLFNSGRIQTRNVGRCPTWWPPCRIQVAPSDQCRSLAVQ